MLGKVRKVSYYDGLISRPEMTPEQRDAEYEELKKQSDALTDWIDPDMA